MNIQNIMSKIEGYPLKYRVFSILAIISLMLGGYWYFIFSPKDREIKRLVSDIEKLDREIIINKKKISNLKQLEKEVKEKEVIFYYAKKLLPESTIEIENLLANIETLGNDVGVDFLLFQPGKEYVSDFYAKRIFTLELQGYFPNLMLFFSHISNLNRLVTIDSVRFRPQRDHKIRANCKMYIYRSLSEEEIKAKQKKKRKRKK